MEFENHTNKIMLRDIDSKNISLSSNSYQNEQQNHTKLMENLKVLNKNIISKDEEIVQNRIESEKQDT
jgi:hypothetical protein